MLNLGNGPLAHHKARAVFDDWLDQCRNCAGVILVVRIAIDDDIGAALQTGLKPGHEGAREALVAGDAHDMIGAIGGGDFRGSIVRPIIDHQRFNDIDASDDFRDRGQSVRDLVRFVEAGDLNDEFHLAIHLAAPGLFGLKLRMTARGGWLVCRDFGRSSASAAKTVAVAKALGVRVFLIKS